MEARCRKAAATTRAALALWLAAAGGALAATVDDWEIYQDEAFGYELAYPAHLFGSPEPAEEADGITLTSHDGRARLETFGGPNTAEHSPASMAEALATIEEVREVTYRRVAGDWVVLSGYLVEPENGEDMIFYWRVNFAEDRRAVSGFRLEYPASQRNQYDELVGRLGSSLTAPPAG